MLPNRISAKLFIENSDDLNVAAFIPIFHTWIREARVPGVPIDVANYSHVKDGPSLLLVGHAGEYVIDFAGGRAGLRYVHKRDWPGDTLASRLETTLEGLFLGARLLQEEPSLQPPLRFNSDELVLTFPDRLNTPNSARTFAALRDDVRATLQDVYASDDVGLTRVTEDERLLLTIAVQTAARPPILDLAHAEEA